MTKRKNKRKGVRSVNGRKKARAVKRPLVGKKLDKHVAKQFERNELEDFQPSTRFWPVNTATPHEGCLLLVRLADNTYRFGMVLKGRFANYDYHAGEFVTMPHPERITHYMPVIPPVPFETARAEAETPEAELPSSPSSIMETALAAGADESEDLNL